MKLTDLKLHPVLVKLDDEAFLSLQKGKVMLRRIHPDLETITAGNVITFLLKTVPWDDIETSMRSE